MHRRKPYHTLVALLGFAAAIALLTPAVSHADTILAMDPIYTTTCNEVCPELTSGMGQGFFTLVGDTTLRGMLFTTFEAPGSYQGGHPTWMIGMVGSNTPLYTGAVNMTQWDMGSVTVSGITLEEYYENFSFGSGIVLTAGNYYLNITDTRSTDQFGIFWATNDTGVAFSLEGKGNQSPGGGQVPGVPEPATWLIAASGLGLMIACGRRATRRLCAS